MAVFRLANLGMPPSSIAIGSGDFPETWLEWIQHPDKWAAIFYHHSNAVSIDAHTFVVEAGDAAFFPPGSRGAHARVGEGTHHWAIVFELPGRSGNLTAIPLHYRGIERFQQDLERAGARLYLDARALKAFAWNLMWAVGRDKAVARAREELYAAEEFILRNLSSQISVANIADAANRSPRQLLRAFRQEHGMTIQEFIRRKRVREATRLLASTGLAPKEIATRVGVANLQAFNKLVREETGLSPRAFRTKVLSDQDV